MIPGWGAKITHAVRPGQKILNKKKTISVTGQEEEGGGADKNESPEELQ